MQDMVNTGATSFLPPRKLLATHEPILYYSNTSCILVRLAGSTYQYVHAAFVTVTATLWQRTEDDAGAMAMECDPDLVRSHIHCSK